MMTTTEAVYALTERFVVAAHTKKASARHSDGFTATERIGGALLLAVVKELAPALRSLRHPLVLAGRAGRRMGVDASGHFVHVDSAKAATRARAAEVLRAEPDLRAVLNHLDVGLMNIDEPEATAGAMFVRNVRAVLDVALRGVPSRSIAP
jgi:hypothetical protein